MMQEDLPVDPPSSEGVGPTNPDLYEFSDYEVTDQGGERNSAETLDYAIPDEFEDEPRMAMDILFDEAERSEFGELTNMLARSTTPEEAREASNILRERNWLLNGALKGIRLQGADLRGVDFSDALLIDADMDEVDLSLADLSGAELEDASLIDANFEGANLEGANFAGADLTGANLKGANCDAADFRDATVTMEQLKQAASLEDAILPDGTQWDQVP
jgi:hypothetical protein